MANPSFGELIAEASGDRSKPGMPGWSVEAIAIQTEDEEVCRQIGIHALPLFKDRMGVLTHCNAGGIPFYVASPLSTIDLQTATGADIPIERRSAEEVTESFSKRTAPQGTKAYNPAFDITPHEYITAIIIQKGMVQAPFNDSLTALFAD